MPGVYPIGGNAGSVDDDLSRHPGKPMFPEVPFHRRGDEVRILPPHESRRQVRGRDVRDDGVLAARADPSDLEGGTFPQALEG